MIRKFIRTLFRIFSPRLYAKFSGVKMGENVFWATRYVPTEAYLIKIGNNVQITEGVKIFTHGCAQIARYKYPNFDLFGKVSIGDWSYIGTDSLIMPGVNIGNHVLVAAGSVVTKSIPDGWVVAGNPAKYICTVEEYINANMKYNLDSKKMTYKEKRLLLSKLDYTLFIHKKFLSN